MNMLTVSENILVTVLRRNKVPLLLVRMQNISAFLLIKQRCMINLSDAVSYVTRLCLVSWIYLALNSLCRAAGLQGVF